MKVWIEAARPRTLSAAVVPVLVGTATAAEVVWWRFGAALVVSLALQVAVNYANDYFDGVRGVDRPDRVGPRRAVASGLVTPSRMKVAIAAALGTAAVAGIALTIAVGPELLLVGAAAIIAALAYSGGPRPYASAGLGEVFVFVFFGPVATVGTAYVQAESIHALAVAASLPVGLFAAAILVVNNLRDIRTDTAAGKRTLAVRLGPGRTRTLYAGLMLSGALSTVAVAWVENAAIGVAMVPMVVPVVSLIREVYGAAGSALVKHLGYTSLSHLAFGVALAVVLWL